MGTRLFISTRLFLFPSHHCVNLLPDEPRWRLDKTSKKKNLLGPKSNAIQRPDPPSRLGLPGGRGEHESHEAYPCTSSLWWAPQLPSASQQIIPPRPQADRIRRSQYMPAETL